MNVLPEHTNFEDIFGRLHLNINLEKIIYLENWTKTEMQTLLIEMFAYDAAIATRPLKL